MRCPTCGKEMFLLGKATNGKWEPTGRYRCSECPAGKNRFEFVNSKMVLIREVKREN